MQVFWSQTEGLKPSGIRPLYRLWSGLEVVLSIPHFLFCSTNNGVASVVVRRALSALSLYCS